MRNQDSKDRKQWHHLLGVAIADLYTGTSYKVEIEKELSLKKQQLDILLIEQKDDKLILPSETPDGLENLNKHNLITFKSHQESLDHWAVQELISHYVTYRKILSTKNKNVSIADFNLYAISTKFPQKLFSTLKPKQLKQGVYSQEILNKIITFIILSEIPNKSKDYIWNLFSNNTSKIVKGLTILQQKHPRISSMLGIIFNQHYNLGELKMSYTIDDLTKEFVQENIHVLDTEQVLSKYSADEVLSKYSADEVLSKYSADEVLSKYSADEKLSGLTVNELEKYLRKIKK
jgi:hypothetical protein